MAKTFSILEDRTLLRVGGKEAKSFLQGLVSNDIDDIQEGCSGFTTLLSPQGKILFDFFIIPDGDSYLLDCLTSLTPSLEKKLKLYKLRAEVTLENLASSMAVAVLYDKNDTVTLDFLGATEHTEIIIVSDPRLAQLGLRIYGPLSPLQSILEEIAPPGQVQQKSDADYHYHCTQKGIASLGHGFDAESVFLLDVNYDALNAVSYKKGCFVGQEVTSRMKRKGNVRKRTVIIESHTGPLDKGQYVTITDDHGVTNIGTLITGGENKALALVRLDRFADKDGVFKAGEVTVTLTLPTYLAEDS